MYFPFICAQISYRNQAILIKLRHRNRTPFFTHFSVFSTFSPHAGLILSSARQLEDHPKSTQVVSELLLRACTSKCLKNQSLTQWLSRLASEKNLIKFCEGGAARNRTKNQFIVLWVKTRKKAQTRTQGICETSIAAV